jgi:hypothetical protein
MLLCSVGQRAQFAIERFRQRRVSTHLNKLFTSIGEASQEIHFKPLRGFHVGNFGAAPIELVQHSRFE